jgi:predicted Zn-dependent protease
MVRQLEVVSLAGQGKFQEARDMLQKLSKTSPPELLRILDGVAPLQADDEQDPFHKLGDLQLEAALRLDQQRAELSPAQQRRLDECLARAYVATRQADRGIEIYEKLLQQAPRDKPLLTSYAELLVKCATKECLKKAVAAWQKLEAMQKAATPEWFALRYQVCRTLVLMEDFAEAGKLLKMTRLLYPRVEDEQWQQKFSELEAQCAKDGSPKNRRGSRAESDPAPR